MDGGAVIIFAVWHDYDKGNPGYFTFFECSIDCFDDDGSNGLHLAFAGLHLFIGRGDD